MPIRLLLVLIPLATSILLHSKFSWADTCTSQAKTELENIFCQLKSDQYGSNLPSLYEFRKNPENMQRLLLKKPARKAGIELPATKKPAVKPAQAKPPSTSATANPKERKNRNTPEAKATRTQLKNCMLAKEEIICGAQRYVLQVNIPNNQLPKTALSAQNQLQLPPRNAPDFREENDLYYLSQCYLLYIDKMLELGLGDSSSSFTRFAAIYEDILRQGGDFPERFKKMYKLLKQEKASNPVKRRYSEIEPENLSQCMPLGRDYLVCDNVEKNWIYKKTGG
ncbi:hypothetical protein SAMN02745866_00419 [Alteromonadaceae bacterium Bs31]|nr:hypothetical protein SAMN02745866_00419 [Alteromonadaceae bacterium Bs31]